MKLLCTIIGVLAIASGVAQNTGIGTTTPLAKLHIFSGPSGNTLPASPVIVEGNSNTYINFLTPNHIESGILFGTAASSTSGGIVYNNGSSLGLQFRTNGNATRMVISSTGEVKIGSGVAGATFDVMRGTNDGGTAIFRGTSHISHFNHSLAEHTYIRAGKNNGYVILNDIPGGRVGINNATPNAPLAFAVGLGKKITLYPGGTGDVGFAVQGNVLQIFADHPNADVAFGYDQASVFTERFRMRGNGTFLLNGNAGNPGQVLQSNGEGTSPTWSHGTNVLYNNTILLLNNTQSELTSSTAINLPGLNHTFSVSGNAKVVINFSIYTSSGACAGCGSMDVFIDILLNGGVAKRYVEDVANGTTNSFAGSTMLQVGPGTHTIQFQAFRFGSNGYIGHPSQVSNAVLQIIPQ